MKTVKTKKVVGVFEPVEFPKFGITDLIAKIDTGAYTGALHCTKIEEIVTPKGKQLHFSPFDHPELTIKTRNHYVSYVKSSDGRGKKRFMIRTTVKIQNKNYPIILSLADRSAMKWPILIGRRFLRANQLLVDVTQSKAESIVTL